MKHLIQFFLSVIRKYIRDEMSVYAAQAAFFILLAAVPFLMVLLSVIRLLQSGSAGAILSVSALFSLWSASKGMLSIERGMNRAYDVMIQRTYLMRRLICSGYTFLFAVMCSISLFFHMSAFFVLLGFTLTFYVALPHRPQRISAQIPGALFSSFGWVIFSSLFSLYIRHRGSFTAIYGSLTTLILFMLWLYICICILFFGAEINAVKVPDI